MPSVRGPQKVGVAALLTATAAATGALAGFVAGALWLAARLPRPTPAAVTVVVVLAIVADRLRRPLAVGRQVPVEWSRLFRPEVVAVLYGARLGVGPLTILSSWLWWAAFLVAAAVGPGTAVAAGAVFGATRCLAMLGVGEYARRAMASRMARLRAGEPAATVAAAVAALAACGLALVS